MRRIDVRHLACPGPVLRLRELLEAGERELCLEVADELARTNVCRFAASRGAETSVESAEHGGFLVTVRAGDEGARPHPGEEAPIACEVPVEGAAPPDRGRRVVVQVAAGTMGHGDDELGALLLRSFLKTQAELSRKPDAILFYNEGVKLCCEGSLLLDDLRTLAAGGVEIVACGTCLNHFGLADRLEVGRVTDMLEIATRLAEADHVVRP